MVERQDYAPQHAPKPSRIETATTVRLSEVIRNEGRMEATAFSIEARNAIAEMRASGHTLIPLYGDGAICHEAHNAFRFKRIFVGPEHGVPFLSSSDIISLKPTTDRFLSRKLTKRLDELIIQPWDVLVSCSGTIGNVGLAGKSLTGFALSQDAIRLRTATPEDAGFVAAFLRSRFGRPQLTQASYGSVISHIEPDHLKNVIIPDLHPVERARVGHLMVEATQCRDLANDLLDKSDAVLRKHLKLEPLRKLSSPTGQVISSVVRRSTLSDRLEASFHAPAVLELEARLKHESRALTALADPQICKEIRAVTRFRKRVYIPRGGVPLLSSKQVLQIDPVDIKRLALGAHRRDLAEIKLDPGMILVSCSGTIGNIHIVPKYMSGWTVNQHALRLITADGTNPGYLYAWLASEYGRLLIQRHAYGSVILEIDRHMLGTVPVPLLSREQADEIGDLVLEANKLRDDAWNLEQRAFRMLETIIASSD